MSESGPKRSPVLTCGKSVSESGPKRSPGVTCGNSVNESGPKRSPVITCGNSVNESGPKRSPSQVEDGGRRGMGDYPAGPLTKMNPEGLFALKNREMCRRKSALHVCAWPF